MQDETERPKGGKTGWGLAASVGLHLVLVVLFLVKLPLPSFEAEKEQVVSVEMVPEAEPVPEPPPEPEPPAPEKQAEAPPEEAPPPPPATLLAVRPPASDAPEREDAQGQTAPQGEPALMETGPKAEEGQSQEAEAASGTPAEAPTEPDAALRAEIPEETARAAMEAATAEEGEVFAATPDHPPLPQQRPAAGAEGVTEGVGLDQPLKPAKKMLSNRRLSDPQVRKALGQLPMPKRILQLCSVEALSQIMAARPGAMLHGILPFSGEAGHIENGVLTASGGAYRTMTGDWYDISFRCAVDVTAMQVKAFDYRLGDHKITRQERLQRGLPGN